MALPLANVLGNPATTTAEFQAAIEAQRQYLEDLGFSDIAGVASVAQLPSASTSARGAVQLSSSTGSTSNTLAATPFAVRSVKESSENASNLSSGIVPVARLPTASTVGRGAVQLSNSTGSTSSTLAATPQAVRSVKEDINALISNGRVASAWVRFDGTGTVAIDDSYNVDYIVDLGSGHYQVHFASALYDANYSAQVTSAGAGASYFAGINGNVPPTTSSLNVMNWFPGVGGADNSIMCVTVHGG